MYEPFDDEDDTSLTTSKLLFDRNETIKHHVFFVINNEVEIYALVWLCLIVNMTITCATSSIGQSNIITEDQMLNQYCMSILWTLLDVKLW